MKKEGREKRRNEKEKKRKSKREKLPCRAALTSRQMWGHAGVFL
jgi:hypothetical protein